MHNIAFNKIVNNMSIIAFNVIVDNMIVNGSCTTETCGGVIGYCAAVDAACMHDLLLVVHILTD